VRSLLLSGIAYLLFPFVSSVWLLALLSFVLGLGVGCGQPLTMMMCYNRAPPGRSGEALGVRFTIVNLTHLAIPVAFGAAGAVVGLAAVFWANGTLLAAGGVLGDALERRARATPP
jgi:sugar phosphate permease